MRQVYTDYPKESCIVSNDMEFELHTMEKILSVDTDKYKKLISRIEKVVFCDDDKIISIVTREPVSLLEISTGCKTIINIICNPDKIVFAIECVLDHMTSP